MAVKKSAAADKQQTPQATSTDASPDTDSDTSRDVWLAGLGALAKAQAEGSKAFEALVSEGIAMQHKAQAMAQERLAEAAQRMEEFTASASSAASGRWDKLEGIFEQRVARALARLGFPQVDELERLAARIDALEQGLQARVPTASGQAAKASPQPAAAAAKPRRAAKTAAKKS